MASALQRIKYLVLGHQAFDSDPAVGELHGDLRGGIAGEDGLGDGSGAGGGAGQTVCAIGSRLQREG